MFCPVCESEYESGIEVCPDDNTPLVDKLTSENTVLDHSEARFVPLHNVGSPAEAVPPSPAREPGVLEVALADDDRDRPEVEPSVRLEVE